MGLEVAPGGILGWSGVNGVLRLAMGRRKGREWGLVGEEFTFAALFRQARGASRLV